MRRDRRLVCLVAHGPGAPLRADSPQAVAPHLRRLRYRRDAGDRLRLAARRRAPQARPLDGRTSRRAWSPTRSPRCARSRRTSGSTLAASRSSTTAFRTASPSVDPAAPRERMALTVGAVYDVNLLRKGHGPFCEAAQSLPDVEFVLAGEWWDDTGSELKAKAPQNLRLTGYLSDEDLDDLFRQRRRLCPGFASRRLRDVARRGDARGRRARGDRGRSAARGGRRHGRRDLRGERAEPLPQASRRRSRSARRRTSPPASGFAPSSRTRSAATASCASSTRLLQASARSAAPPVEFSASCAGLPIRPTAIGPSSSWPTRSWPQSLSRSRSCCVSSTRARSPSATSTCSWRRSPSSRSARRSSSPALGLHAKWWRYFLTRDFPALLRATALASAVLVVVFTVVSPFDYNLPRSVVVFDFILTTGLLAGARIVTRLVDRAAVEGGARAQDARLPDHRRRLGRPDGRARAPAQPGAWRQGDRLRRRRPAQAGDGPPGPSRPRNHGSDR